MDDERRREILEAARQIFERDSGATVEELAQVAGTSRATVYRLFRSRREVVREAGLAPDPDSRQRVLAAAAELVGRDGLTRLSMDELAAAAGLSRASLYRLFPGKAALFRELVRVYSPMQTVVRIVRDSGDRPPQEVIPRLALEAAAVLRGRMGIVRSLLFEMLNASPDSEEAVDWAFSEGVMTVAGYVAEQMRLRRLRAMHPVVALTSLVGPVLFHLLTRPLLERELALDLPLEETVEQLAQGWLRSMEPR